MSDLQFPNPADKFAGRIIDHERRLAALELALYDSGLDGSYVNLLDNGAMNIAQRGAQVTGATTNKFLVDRWQLLLNALGTWTYSVDTDVPLGEEFTSSAKLLVTTADATPAAGDYAQFVQTLEGLDVQHLLYGSVVAESTSVSFWVKSNVSGVMNVELQNLGGTSRYIAAAYTIGNFGIWEKKTLTIPGDVAQAITNDNAGRFRVAFWLAAGSNFAGGTSVQSSWGLTSNGRAYNQTNIASAVDNFIKFTGIQLEIGSPSPFETRQQSTELRRCMRYFERMGGAGGFERLGMGQAATTTTSQHIMEFKVTKRAAPTITFNGAASNFAVTNAAAGAVACTVVASANVTTRNFLATLTVAAGLVAGDASQLMANNTANGYIDAATDI